MADMALVIEREVGCDAEQEAARIVDRRGIARVRRTQPGFLREILGQREIVQPPLQETQQRVAMLEKAGQQSVALVSHGLPQVDPMELT